MPEKDSELDARQPLDRMLFAENTRLLRLSLGLTQKQLAEKAGVAPTTVYSVEGGVQVRTNTLNKIAIGLNANFNALAHRHLRINTPERPYSAHRANQTIWFAEEDRRTRIPQDNQERIQDPVERLRLGRLGLVSFFVTLPSFVMINGPGLTFFELYGRIQGPINAGIYRSCVLHCMRSAAFVTVAQERVPLGEGESLGCSTADLGIIEVQTPVTGEQLPTLLLWVGADRIGKVPS